jgi:hypothetical protein
MTRLYKHYFLTRQGNLTHYCDIDKLRTQKIYVHSCRSFTGKIEWPMANQNVAWVLTGRGLMDCLQYYDNCLFLNVVKLLICNTDLFRCFRFLLSEMFSLKYMLRVTCRLFFLRFMWSKASNASCTENWHKERTYRLYCPLLTLHIVATSTNHGHIFQKRIKFLLVELMIVTLNLCLPDIYCCFPYISFILTDF